MTAVGLSGCKIYIGSQGLRKRKIRVLESLAGSGLSLVGFFFSLYNHTQIE